MAKTSVIIAAAGESRRFGGKTKKPFVPVDGRALFMRAIEIFVNRSDVCQILLTVAPQDREYVKTKFGPHLGLTGVKLVEGGRTRTDSVANALGLVEVEAELVAVHDAVRPCVQARWIDEVFAAAARDGAAILAAPLTDTLKRSEDGRHVAETLDRQGLWVAQTPQVFQRLLLVKAYEQKELLARATDEAQLVEALGHAVTLVPADPTNIKITRPGDVKVAEAILKGMPKPKAKGPLGPYEEDKMW